MELNLKAVGLKGVLMGVAVLGLSQAAWALPFLQLDILGGTYDPITQTTMASGNSFTLRALLNPDKVPSGDNKYYISAAIVPQTTDANSFGTFEVNGTTYSGSLGMQYGGPPVDNAFPALPSHGIYDTWYAEIEFAFNPTDQVSPAYNTADGSTVGSPGYLLYHDFSVDISGLTLLLDASGYAVHFDLYDTRMYEVVRKIKKGLTVTQEEYDLAFAPFSHDAQSLTVTQVPDGSTTITLLGMAMIGLGILRRRFQ